MVFGLRQEIFFCCILRLKAPSKLYRGYAQYMDGRLIGSGLHVMCPHALQSSGQQSTSTVPRSSTSQHDSQSNQSLSNHVYFWDFIRIPFICDTNFSWGGKIELQEFFEKNEEHLARVLLWHLHWFWLYFKL